MELSGSSGCGSEQPFTVSGAGLVSWEFPQGSDKAAPLPGSQPGHSAAEHCRGHPGVINSLLSSKAP